MANITKQFVTSFSELYYSTTQISAVDTDLPTGTEVRTWFDEILVEQSSRILVGAATAGADVSITVDGLTFTIVSVADLALDAAALALAIDNDNFLIGAATTVLLVKSESLVKVKLHSLF